MVNSIKNHIGSSNLLKKLCKKLEHQKDIEPLILSKVPEHIRPFCRLVHYEHNTITLSCRQPAYFTELHYSHKVLIDELNSSGFLDKTIEKIIWRPEL